MLVVLASVSDVIGIITISGATCEENEVYLKMIKKTMDRASEESFVIMSGDTSVYTSPSLANYQTRTLETCLPDSLHQKYSLKMLDSGNDSWQNGGWIELIGINGNVVLKAIMVENSEEIIPFSLYSPIHVNSVWKFTNGASGNWMQPTFSDEAWTSVTLGTSTTSSSTGTQYFRKTFDGLTDMAAIDLEFKYKHGIIAYLNGVEVYRDNMPSGDVNSETLASGGYTDLAFRGIIRSSAIAEGSQCLLAVEVHFRQAGYMETIEFDGFITYSEGLSSENRCYVSPVSITGTSTSFSSPNNMFGWSRASYSSVSADQLPAYVTTTFSGNVVPLVNGFRIYPYTDPQSAPREFTVEGASTPSSSYSPLLNARSISYSSKTWKQFSTLVTPDRYSSYKITVSGTSSTRVEIYEFQFLVCNIPPPTSITYPESSYSFLSRYDSIGLSSSVFGLQNCQISPSLPTGLTLDTDCYISGSSLEASPQTTYTITASTGSASIQGTVTLTFTDCSGTMIHILRAYRFNTEYEAFRIRNTANDEILLDVPLGQTLPMYTDWHYYLCVMADRFDVTLYSSNNAWVVNSFLYIYGLLPEGTEEMLLKGRYDANQNNDHVFYLRRHAIRDS